VKYLASIVEGHGEVEALPALIHRIAIAAQYGGDLRVNPPIRVKSGSFLNDEEYFRKQVRLRKLRTVVAACLFCWTAKTIVQAN
jgi:hypothetical protein